MNKKLFFNIIFFTVGTFIIVVCSVILSLNFFKDAKIFQKAVVAAVVEKPAASPVDKNLQQEEPVKKDDEYKTIQYKRDPSAEVQDATQYDEKTIPKANKIKVQVVNYTDIKKLAEEIRTTLEASGYEVSSGNAKSNTPMKTLIVEKNDKKAGAEIHKILKAGKVVKWPDAKSRFDVTVIIGDDFKP